MITDDACLLTCVTLRISGV